MISCYLLLTDVVIDPDVGSEDTEMLGIRIPCHTMCIFLIHFSIYLLSMVSRSSHNYSLQSSVAQVILLFVHKATNCPETTCLLYVQASLYFLFGAPIITLCA